MGHGERFSNVRPNTAAASTAYCRSHVAKQMPRATTRENIINDGTTTSDSAIGALADFALAVRSKKIEDDIMVACADTVFYPDAVRDFDSK
jgi:hypothetical protein